MTSAQAYFEEQEFALDSTLSGQVLSLAPETLLSERSGASITFVGREAKNYSPRSVLSVRVNRPISWIRRAVESLESLLALEEDWDSYGARKINQHAARAALILLENVMDDQAPSPSIVPTPAGNIQLEWHESEIDLEVEITPNSTFLISFEDGSGQVEPCENDSPVNLVNDPKQLSSYLNEIARRTIEESTSIR